MKPKTAHPISEQLTSLESKFRNDELPKVTVVIPTFNNAKPLRQTIENVLEQKYANLEIIVIDANSSDKTQEAIKNFQDARIRVYTVAAYYCYAMLNMGITHATGEYVCFMFPGDRYIYIHTLRHMMSLALENSKPDLVFCGTLLRDGKSEVKPLYRELSLSLLKRGRQPTSLQSCWIRLDVIKELGKFDASYKFRGAYEFFCRYSLNERRRTVSSRRFYLDYDIRSTTSHMLFGHFWETFRVVWHHFGLMPTAAWLFYQKDAYRFIKLWGRRWRSAFLGK